MKANTQIDLPRMSVSATSVAASVPPISETRVENSATRSVLTVAVSTWRVPSTSPRRLASGQPSGAIAVKARRSSGAKESPITKSPSAPSTQVSVAMESPRFGRSRAKPAAAKVMLSRRRWR